LVLEICRELHLLQAMGVPADWDHRTQGYSRYSEGLRIHEVLSAHLPVLLPALMAPGDIVTLRDDVGDPSHMGLLGDAGRPFSLIHAWCAPVASRAKVQEHRLTGHWRRALYRAYRLPLEEYPAWPA